MTLWKWGGNMKFEEFKKYMNQKFDELIKRLCPQPKTKEEEK